MHISMETHIFQSFFPAFTLLELSGYNEGHICSPRISKYLLFQSATQLYTVPNPFLIALGDLILNKAIPLQFPIDPLEMKVGLEFKKWILLQLLLDSNLARESKRKI